MIGEMDSPALQFRAHWQKSLATMPSAQSLGKPGTVRGDGKRGDDGRGPRQRGDLRYKGAGQQQQQILTIVGSANGRGGALGVYNDVDVGLASCEEGRVVLLCQVSYVFGNASCPPKKGGPRGRPLIGLITSPAAIFTR